MPTASSAPEDATVSPEAGLGSQHYDANAFETARDRTLYWTLSIYIDAQTVARRCGPPHLHERTTTTETFRTSSQRLQPVSAEIFRAVQRAHVPSIALRNAIEPLFNDIADRERLGAVQDFLLAAGQSAPGMSLEQAAAAIRKATTLQFVMPAEFSWTTEGNKFTCALEADAPLLREVNLRRFWFAHSNGALSYHLAFSHYYGDHLDETKPSGMHAEEPLRTYYFLSLLQKLAAPKEFTLDQGASTVADERSDKSKAQERTVFDKQPLKIDPLDKIRVRDGNTDETFWGFVKEKLDSDASVLFAQLLAELKQPLQSNEASLAQTTLVELVEVPGLKLPRCRSLFHFHDKQFFERLLPWDQNEKEPIARKRMVQDRCYEPYGARLNALRKRDRQVRICTTEEEDDEEVLSIKWLTTRSDYEDAFALADPPMFSLGSDSPNGTAIADFEKLTWAMRTGCCWLLRSPITEEALKEPEQLACPAFEARRRDCLDYLFLAGFNQNIIDWLNQDTSEILDSIDPIYPTEDEQANERFFVRYANHRAMITYVPRSRSLEIGNDYIGTCPYAFLIHVLALHNEYIAREHELYADQQITELTQLISRAKDPKDFAGVEEDINYLKAASYNEFEKHRYQNVFRYDTEREVFASIEVLRGMERRTVALSGAIQTLEDKSRDVERRRLRDVDNEAQRRQAVLSNWLGIIGASSAVGLVFAVSDFLSDRQPGYWNRETESLGGYVAGNVALGLTFALPPFFLYIWYKLVRKKSTGPVEQAVVAPTTEGEPRQSSERPPP